VVTSMSTRSGSDAPAGHGRVAILSSESSIMEVKGTISAALGTLLRTGSCGSSGSISETK